MKKTINLILILIFVSGLSYAGYAKKGIVEFGGTASYSSNDVLNMLTLAPEVDYFIKDNISVGGVFSYTNMKVNGNENSNTALIASGKYFFSVDSAYLFPYAGVLLNIEKDNNALGINGGLKRTFLSNTLINMGIQYLLGGDNDLVLFVGFAIYK